MSNDADSVVDHQEDVHTENETWLPRRSVRDTNLLYCVDTLRTYDHWKIEVQLHSAMALMCNTMRALSHVFNFRYSSLDS